MGWFGKEDDRHFDPYAYEDDALNDPTVIGILAAVVIVLIVIAVGAWLDGNPTVAGAAVLLERTH